MQVGTTDLLPPFRPPAIATRRPRFEPFCLFLPTLLWRMMAAFTEITVSHVAVPPCQHAVAMIVSLC